MFGMLEPHWDKANLRTLGVAIVSGLGGALIVTAIYTGSDEVQVGKAVLDAFNTSSTTASCAGKDLIAVQGGDSRNVDVRGQNVSVSGARIYRLQNWDGCR